MKVRCSTTLISALVLSLCLITSIPTALNNTSTWNERTITLPYGAIWNFLAPLGFAYIGIVLIGLIVLWTSYRKKERWAWFVMLIALLFFYFPSYMLPVVLQSRRFGWPHLVDLLGVFRFGGGWWQCWIASWRPNSVCGIACVPFLILIRPVEFLAMSIALILPVKEFFWKPVPHQPGMRPKIATLSLWVIEMLIVVAIAAALMGRGRIAPSRLNMAENLQPIIMPFAPTPMVAVFLAKAEHPVVMPEAGQEDAIVLAVTPNAYIFQGPNKVDLTQLDSLIRNKLADKIDKTIYLRADAQTKYRDVEDVIDALRDAGAEEFGLLTQRKEDFQPGDYLWIGNPLLKSVGLEVFSPSSPTSPGSTAQDGAVVVHVGYRPNAVRTYTINAANVTHAELKSKLTAIYASRADRTMFVTGDDNLRFSDIVDVIDLGKASNVHRIVLLTPGLIRQSGPHQAHNPSPKLGNHAKSTQELE